MRCPRQCKASATLAAPLRSIIAFRGSSFGYQIVGIKFRVPDFGYKVWGIGFWVSAAAPLSFRLPNFYSLAPHPMTYPEI